MNQAASDGTERPRVLAVVPARHASSRFPGKVLAPLAGRPVVAHVIAAAQAAAGVDAVLVATDHEDIAAVARAAGAEVVLTRGDHATGTDRIGEAIVGREAEIILNVQGDEPLLPPAAIDRLIGLLLDAPWAAASTLACTLAAQQHDDPNVVKVVAAPDGRALYFSRAAIPARHPRSDHPVVAHRHIGLYAYRRAALERFLAAEPTPLERTEGLEQLRLLERGEAIVVGVVEELPPGVDTPGDLEACERLLARGKDAV